MNNNFDIKVSNNYDKLKVMGNDIMLLYNSPKCESSIAKGIPLAWIKLMYLYSKKVKKYVPLSKRQDKPDSALWLIKHHPQLKNSQIAKLVGITSNSVSSIRNKNYWNYNSLNPKDPVAMGLFSQKDLVNSIEKAERRIKREKKEKEKERQDKTI